MAAWKLPVVVAALVVPIVAGFYVAGPALGVALGALAVFALLAIAIRQRPWHPIGTLPEDGSRRVLLVVASPVAAPDAVQRLISAAELDSDGAEVMVLAPARIRFLDRWASDVEGARHGAQQNLVVTVAALAKAGIEAEARVGDEDFVQAIEDQLQSFRASEVVLVSADRTAAEDAGAAAEELLDRLQAEFLHLVLAGG